MAGSKGAPEDAGVTDVLTADGADQWAAIRSFRLEVVAGPDAGLIHESDGERTVIGTHESATVVLSDPTVSRFHCQITAGDGHARIEDLESRNGTVVDGVSVIAGYLGARSILTLGNTELRFELRADDARVPLAPQERFGLMVGRSPAMRAAFATLESAARCASTVLLHGDAGTGKDIAAASIHFEGDRRGGPFIVVDCASTAADSLAGELERAGGGTLLLEEVGELSPAAQSHLVRLLDRDGGDARIIATSRRNLRMEVNARRFRSDLYYQLAVLEIALPPLRERPEDVPLLVTHLLETMGAAYHPAAAALRTAGAVEELAGHAWPGNVRELRNYLERCVALHHKLPLDGAAETDPDQVPAIDTSLTLREGRERWVRYFERRYLAELLRQNDDNVSATARAAGVDRVHLYRLLSRAGLR